ncbi:MAG: hypothetical protein KJ739_09145 [Nitrospinae bacterium]|nr:hypothetical protein [Nitrospinota bacterium]
MMEGGEKKSLEELQKEFYETLTKYFSVRYMPTGFFNTIGKISERLEQLNNNIIESSESSTNLASALNRITFWGILIAGSGVVVALFSLLFEIFEYFEKGH